MSETKRYFVAIYFRPVNRMVEALFRPATRRLAKTAFLEMLEQVQRRKPFTRGGVYRKVGELECSRSLLAKWCDCTPSRARLILETFQSSGLITKKPGKSPSDPHIVRINDLWAYVGGTTDVNQPDGKNTSEGSKKHQHSKHAKASSFKGGYGVADGGTNTGEGSQNHQPFNKGHVIKGEEHAEIDIDESIKRPSSVKQKSETWREPCFDLEQELPMVEGIEPHELMSIVREYCNKRGECFIDEMPEGHRSCVDHIENAIDRLDTAKADRDISNPGAYLRTILRDDLATVDESPYNGSWKLEKNAKIPEHEARADEYAKQARPRRMQRA